MTFRYRLLTILFLTGLLPAVQAAPSLAARNAWVAEGPPVASVLAGYLILENPGPRDIAITAARCPEFQAVEIHEMRMMDGMMEMRQVKTLVIPAGGRVELAPGGFHLMLIKPGRVFRAGDTITVTLQLDNGQSLAVPMPVKKRDAGGMRH